jgi:hypothetical protein
LYGHAEAGFHLARGKKVARQFLSSKVFNGRRFTWISIGYYSFNFGNKNQYEKYTGAHVRTAARPPAIR